MDGQDSVMLYFGEICAAGWHAHDLMFLFGICSVIKLKWLPGNI
jgi:hypothetical protein